MKSSQFLGDSLSAATQFADDQVDVWGGGGNLDPKSLTENKGISFGTGRSLILIL